MEALRRFAVAHGLAELQDAVSAARSRTLRNIGTQVKQGMFRIVQTDYGIDNRVKGSRVTHLSGWVSKTEAIEILKGF